MNDLLNIDKRFNGEDFRNKFFQYLDVGSKETIKTYYNGITNFITYIYENEIEYPNREDVLMWKAELKEKTSASTVNTWLVGVKRFFKFLSLYNMYPNICEDIKGYKISQTPKKNILTEEQIKNIYEDLKNDYTETGIRNKALFSLLITTGLRGVEVANAKIENIKEVNGKNCLFIRCKGHSENDEYVKLADNVMQDIREYIGDRTEGYIFISNSNHNKGQGMSTKSIRYIIKGIFRECGINDDTISLHSTRRTFACESYNLGKSIYDIQQVLHHTSILTTQRYLKQADRNNNDAEELVASIL